MHWATNASWGAGAGWRRLSSSILREFQNYDDFWAPCLLGQGPAGAYVKRLAADRVAALREDLRRLLGDPADAFVLPARMWAVCGLVASS
jgi:hypothetical protein